jgi:hypothetical protein
MLLTEVILKGYHELLLVFDQRIVERLPPTMNPTTAYNCITISHHGFEQCSEYSL